MERTRLYATPHRAGESGLKGNEPEHQNDTRASKRPSAPRPSRESCRAFMILLGRGIKAYLEDSWGTHPPKMSDVQAEYRMPANAKMADTAARASKRAGVPPMKDPDRIRCCTVLCTSFVGFDPMRASALYDPFLAFGDDPWEASVGRDDGSVFDLAAWEAAVNRGDSREVSAVILYILMLLREDTWVGTRERSVRALTGPIMVLNGDAGPDAELVRHSSGLFAGRSLSDMDLVRIASMIK